MNLTLITGATGLLGRAWLGHLLAAQSERRIIALCRRPGHFHDSRVTEVFADLARDEIVLPGGLRHSVTDIIHSAADIRFGLPLDEARAHNVTATAKILEFARRCPRLRKLGHISSVYAAGRLTGNIAEAPFPAAQGFFNTYEQSKYEAEKLVCEAIRELPVAIFRLSSVIGDASGRVRQFNYFHQTLRRIPRNPIASLAANPQTPVDLIPGDWAVSALAYLFEHCFTTGRVYHVCAGPERCYHLQELVDVTFARLQMPAPVLVQDGLNARQLDGGVEWFLPHLQLYQAFENQHTMRDLLAAGLDMPPIRSVYPRVLESIFNPPGASQLDPRALLVPPDQSPPETLCRIRVPE